MAKYDLSTVRHSASHVMAHAVKKLFPGVKLGIGPSIDDGFYYDFDLPEGKTISDNDLLKLEEMMAKIVKGNHPFKMEEVAKGDARKLLEEMGETYKLELLNEIEGDSVTLYRHDDFVDLCKGPHVRYTKEIKAFKLLKVAGAYWRGSEKNPMLTRVYGTAFGSKQELEDYLNQIEEAAKRDHRRLGTDLDLFSSLDDYGPGLILWHPNGGRVRGIIESFWKEQHYKNGYDILYTPHIGRSSLWETSGHLEFYCESMYSPMDIDGNDYYIKPMNCPFHIKVYQARSYSYRDLPLRWAELGTVYRYEKSGVLHGLLRVRGFTQDDAHIICTPEQTEDEIGRVLRFSIFMWKSFGFSDFEIFLSTKPEKHVGSDDEWDLATDALRKTLDESGLEWTEDPGEGVFYGPKIDIKIKDSLGRYWQMTTIQFDFNLPERFDMTYVGADGQKHRPYMVHRALLGSIERFFGVLIEHYAGVFPLWLAPVQARILTITDDFVQYAKEVFDKLSKAGIRVQLDDRSEKLGLKIRESEIKKTPYMLIVGGKEVENGTVSVRSRADGDLGSIGVEELLKRLEEEIKSKK